MQNAHLTSHLFFHHVHCFTALTASFCFSTAAGGVVCLVDVSQRYRLVPAACVSCGVAHLFVTLNLALNLAFMCTSSTCLSKLSPTAKSDLVKLPANELDWKQMLLSRSPVAIVISTLGVSLGLIETAEHNVND